MSYLPPREDRMMLRVLAAFERSKATSNRKNPPVFSITEHRGRRR